MHLAETNRAMGKMTFSEAGDLPNWVEAQLPCIVGEAYDNVLEKVPHFARAELPLQQDLHQSIDDNLRSAVAAMIQAHDASQVRAPRETARRRARQGVPLAEVLQANHISFGTLWDALVRATRPGGGCEDPGAFVAVASWLWAVADAYSTALTESYRAASAELLAEERRRRSALVESLLSGRSNPDCSPSEMASLLGFAPDGDLMVVAADSRGTTEESLAEVEVRLADRGIVSGWWPTPTLRLGIVAIHAGQYEEVLSVLRSFGARAGVSPAYTALADTPRALRLARSALSSLRSGQAVVREFDPSPLAALLACESNEGRRLAEVVLEGVLELNVSDRGTILDTLTAYFDNEGSAERAAEQLYCHVNTIRYRLRRVHELTGRSLKDPLSVAELVSAVFSLRLGNSSDSAASSGSSGSAPSSA